MTTNQPVKHRSSIFPGKLRAVVFVQNLSIGPMKGITDFKLGRHMGTVLPISVHGFRSLVALVLAPHFLGLQKKLNYIADDPSTLIYKSVEGFEVFACEALTNHEGYVLEVLKDGWRLVLLLFLRKCPVTLELEVWNFLGYAPKTWNANTSFLELKDGMHFLVSAFQELARDPDKMLQVLREIQISNSGWPAVFSNLVSVRLALLVAKAKRQFWLFGSATPTHASSFFDPFCPEQFEQEQEEREKEREVQTSLSSCSCRPAGRAKPASDQSGATAFLVDSLVTGGVSAGSSVSSSKATKETRAAADPVIADVTAMTTEEGERSSSSSSSGESCKTGSSDDEPVEGEKNPDKEEEGNEKKKKKKKKTATNTTSVAHTKEGTERGGKRLSKAKKRKAAGSRNRSNSNGSSQRLPGPVELKKKPEEKNGSCRSSSLLPPSGVQNQTPGRKEKDCKYCRKKFEDAHGLGLHTVCLHLLRSNFFCPHCLNTFLEDYGTHFSRHHQHLCLLCNRTLSGGHNHCANVLLQNQLALLEAENFRTTATAARFLPPFALKCTPDRAPRKEDIQKKFRATSGEGTIQ